MDKTLFTLAFILIACVAASADLQQEPWRGVFEDTVLAGLEPSLPDSLGGNGKVYRNFEQSSFNAVRALSPAPGVTIRPNVSLYSERFRESNQHVKAALGDMNMTYSLTGRIALELFGSAQEAFAGTDNGKNIKEDRATGGGGIKIMPLPNTAARVAINTIYSRRIIVDSSTLYDPGYGFEAAASSGVHFLIDTLTAAGEIQKQEQERSNRMFSYLSVMGSHALNLPIDEVRFRYKQTGGAVHDRYENIEYSEENFLRLGAVQMHAKAGDRISGTFYWNGSIGENMPMQNVETRSNVFAAGATLQLEKTTVTGVVGRNDERQENSVNKMLSNNRNHFWLEGDVLFRPRWDVRLEYHGLGKKIAADYRKLFSRYGDTLSLWMDNDYVTTDNFVKGSYCVSPGCSAFAEGRYSENITQFLSARNSRSNSRLQVYMFGPSVYWSAADIFSHRQRFELSATYNKNPFSPSKNYLLRKMNCISNIQVASSLRDRIRATYDYKNEDLGSIDTANYYMIDSKLREHDARLEWERATTEWLTCTPGFGAIYDVNSKWNYDTKSYRRDEDFSGMSYVYSIKIAGLIKGQKKFALSISYRDDLTGARIWDANAQYWMGL